MFCGLNKSWMSKINENPIFILIRWKLCNLGNVTSVLFFCKNHSYGTVFLLEKTFDQEWSAILTSAGALITRTTAGFEEYGIQPNQKQGPRHPNRISDCVKVLGQWKTSLLWLSLWRLHKWVRSIVITLHFIYFCVVAGSYSGKLFIGNSY